MANDTEAQLAAVLQARREQVAKDEATNARARSAMVDAEAKRIAATNNWAKNRRLMEIALQKINAEVEADGLSVKVTRAPASPVDRIETAHVLSGAQGKYARHVLSVSRTGVVSIAEQASGTNIHPPGPVLSKDAGEVTEQDFRAAFIQCLARSLSPELR